MTCTHNCFSLSMMAGFNGGAPPVNTLFSAFSARSAKPKTTAAVGTADAADETVLPTKLFIISIQ